MQPEQMQLLPAHPYDPNIYIVVFRPNKWLMHALPEFQSFHFQFVYRIQLAGQKDLSHPLGRLTNAPSRTDELKAGH